MSASTAVGAAPGASASASASGGPSAGASTTASPSAAAGFTPSAFAAGGDDAATNQPRPPPHPAHLTAKLARVWRPNDAERAAARGEGRATAGEGREGDMQMLDRPLYSLEFFPPKTAQGLENLYARIARMARPGAGAAAAPAPGSSTAAAAAATASAADAAGGLVPPSWVNITWGAGGTTDRWSVEMAGRIQQGQLPWAQQPGQPRMNGGASASASCSGNGNDAAAAAAPGVDAVLHLTCTNVTVESLRRTLSAARGAGVRNVLALRGDAPRGAEYWVAALDERFQHAEDLVRFIREEHPDGWFCIGVAGYPEGHPDDALLAAKGAGAGAGEGEDAAPSDAVERDVAALLRKQAAGADFVITQLFYDVRAFLAWERRARAAGLRLPIVPGVMPIASYAALRRMTSLCRVRVPEHVLDDLQAVRSDDAKVREYGARLCTSIMRTIWEDPHSEVRAFHLCTLNLEKTVTRVIAACDWWRTEPSQQVEHPQRARAPLAAQPVAIPRNRKIQTDEEQRSPPTQFAHLSISPSDAVKASLATLGTSHAAARLAGKAAPGGGSGGDAAAAAVGAATRVGDTWDEFPNGRFGDIRSPAYGELDGYGATLKIPPAEALRTWGSPRRAEDISALFVAYLEGRLDAIPWCDGPLAQETDAIRGALLELNGKRHWWTVGSQPAVDGVDSADPAFGFGPRGGYVYQKAFVELFVTEQDKDALKKRIDADAQAGALISFFAGNRAGAFETNMEPGKANAVTWAVFPGQEIVQPTIIEEESFKAWCQEAFQIWAEWELLFPLASDARKCLKQIGDQRWLVTVVHHDYRDPDALWRFLSHSQE